MIVSNPMGKQLKRTLSLCARFFFLGSSVVVARSCSEACAALGMGYSLSDSTDCFASFEAIQAAEPVAGYAPEVQWSWWPDGLDYGADSQQLLFAESAQGGSTLTLISALTPLASEEACACSLEMDLVRAFGDCNWPGSIKVLTPAMCRCWQQN